MKASQINIPLHYKLANVLGELLMSTGLPILRLDEQTVCAKAMKQTGLTDFGDPYFRQGLSRLIESAEKDANLHPLGRFMVLDIITNYLVQRLRLVETRQKEPETFQQPLIPPLIITGLARSGTTFLHRMLALDPAHRALPQWLLIRPFPEKREKSHGKDPRLSRMEMAIRFRQPLTPGFDAIHYTRADTYEECIWVLGLTFNSLAFGTLLPVSSYQEWYMEQKDTFQKYREYRWLLQVFQSHERDQRLTMKAPAHTGNLEALTQAVPQAMVIQTHRDPVACISSVCSLLHSLHLAVAYEIDIQRLTGLTLRQYEVWFRRNLAFRRSRPDVVYDVYFDSLVTDPIGTVRGIYSNFDLPWTDRYASELETFIQSNPKDKHGRHRYSASDFGLTDAEIADRFKFYTDYFGL